MAARGLRPGFGDGEGVEEAKGDGAFDPVTSGGDSIPPSTFFGNEALRFARAAGSGGFWVEEVDICEAIECPLSTSLPLLEFAEALPAIIRYLARVSGFNDIPALDDLDG